MSVAVEIHMGDRIYYTGDRANSAAWTKVISLDGFSVQLEHEADGHVMDVFRQAIGDLYQGHCDPRFVTERAYREYYRQTFPGLGPEMAKRAAEGRY